MFPGTTARRDNAFDSSLSEHLSTREERKSREDRTWRLGTRLSDWVSRTLRQQPGFAICHFRVYRDASSVQNFPETLYEWTKVTDDSLREDRKYKMISTARFHGSSTQYKDSDRVVTRDVCVCAHAHRRENDLGK